MQGDLGTVKSGVGAVVVDGTGQLLAATGELDCEVTDVQAQPVGVTQGLVGSVDCGDRVLEVHDVGDSGFQDDVLDTSLVGLADRGLRINQQLNVQTVVLEVNGLRCVLVAGVADQGLRLTQTSSSVTVQGGLQMTVDNVVRGDVRVGTVDQRQSLVQEVTTPCDNAVTADLVVARGVLLRTAIFRNSVGAVQRVVKRAPACVRSVDGETGVEDRHNQLRASGGSDLGVDALGGDLEVTRVVNEVADFLQECDVLVLILLARVLLVPSVELFLQLIALGQQLAVARSVLSNDVTKAIPELSLRIFRRLTNSRQQFIINKRKQTRCDM